MKLRPEQITKLGRFAQTLRVLLDGQSWRRYQADGYMPLNVEDIGDGCISISHYGEQNGDVMRDPEVVFRLYVIGSGGELAFPVYFRNDYAGVENGNYWDQDPESMPKFSPSMVDFCAMWFRNLKEQGYLTGEARAI